MAALDRTVMETWSINDAADMQSAIDEAQDLVSAEGSDNYLSFLVMPGGECKNVDKVTLIKIDLSDSFAYELELA